MQIGRSGSKRGRHRIWKAGLGEQLVRDVENLRAQNKKKLTAIEALRYLKKTSPDWKSYTIQNLEHRHREAKAALRLKEKSERALSQFIKQFLPNSSRTISL